MEYCGSESGKRGYALDRLWGKDIFEPKYFSNLRIEKLDAETGEPILHDDAVFGVYRAERNEADDGDGAVRCYTADTMILGSRYFLEAMGAKGIRPFARKAAGAGELFYGTVPAGTPICQESDLVSFTDKNGLQTGTLMAIPTIRDIEEKGILQAVGIRKNTESASCGGLCAGGGEAAVRICAFRACGNRDLQ